MLHAIRRTETSFAGTDRTRLVRRSWIGESPERVRDSIPEWGMGDRYRRGAGGGGVDASESPGYAR